MGFSKTIADGLLEPGSSTRTPSAWASPSTTPRSPPRSPRGAPTSRSRPPKPRVRRHARLREDGAPDPREEPQDQEVRRQVREKEIRNLHRMSPSDFREYQRGSSWPPACATSSRPGPVSENEASIVLPRESTATLDYVRFDRRFFDDLPSTSRRRPSTPGRTPNKEEVDKAWESAKAQVLPECRSVRESSSSSTRPPPTTRRPRPRADRARPGASTRAKTSPTSPAP